MRALSLRKRLYIHHCCITLYYEKGGDEFREGSRSSMWKEIVGRFVSQQSPLVAGWGRAAASSLLSSLPAFLSLGSLSLHLISNLSSHYVVAIRHHQSSLVGKTDLPPRLLTLLLSIWINHFDEFKYWYDMVTAAERNVHAASLSRREWRVDCPIPHHRASFSLAYLTTRYLPHEIDCWLISYPNRIAFVFSSLSVQL